MALCECNYYLALGIPSPLSEADGWIKLTFEETMHLLSHLVVHQCYRRLVVAASDRVSLLSVHVLSAYTKSPHYCCIVPHSSRKTWQKLHQAHHAKLCQCSSFSLLPPPPRPPLLPPPPAFLSPPPRVFPQGRLMKSSCNCNESIIKIKQLLSKAREVCFSLNDTGLLNLPCHWKKKRHGRV